MMVTFVSQCQKNSLKKTRRVLDAFADRIGDNTWQTVITEEGLLAVKKLLRKSASKNTAVSCHWIRSRSRSQFLWVVGNKDKFSGEGVVPVNSSKRNLLERDITSDWKYLPLIKALTALSALFHDWGKASAVFQEKLEPKSSNKFKGDPIRHEWISTLLLTRLINNTSEENDVSWLTKLANEDIDENQFKDFATQEVNKPLEKLPNAAKLIAWLIVSHHRLPSLSLEKANGWKDEPAKDINATLKRITKQWGYENNFDEDSYKNRIAGCFEFPQGLLSQSKGWHSQVKRWANRLLECLPLVDQAINDGSYRLVLHHARLCLMLGDHYYSSLDIDDKNSLAQNASWHSDSSLNANTDKAGNAKQTLDEHLCGVAINALQTAHLLPAFEQEPPVAKDVQSLRKQSPKDYQWQDKAVAEIKGWRVEQGKTNKGFFAVNMASTGCGKTFANAKVMRALSPDGKSLRFILALGLRTLTLQTGDEYRSRVFNEKDNKNAENLAVLIGSKAVADLHHLAQKEKEKRNYEEMGSGSQESLLDEFVDYDCDIPEDGLATVLTKDKDRKFLYAPVLACTIDHLMAATETKRGGRYILPSLRLMSSDLVIDEIDDFTGADLIAIGRLIHLAGMLGRKVMISSATIPPDLAEGYFNAYQAGWRIFSQSRDNAATDIGCAWIDEFKTLVITVKLEGPEKAIEQYQQFHDEFIDKRVSKLRKETVKRKVDIVECPLNEEEQNTENDLTKEQRYFAYIKQAIIAKHEQHHTLDKQTGIRVSFGVVRVANIAPCIALTRYLLQSNFPETFAIKVLPYHSQQVLLLRHEQEKHLDSVLKRKEKTGDMPQAFDNTIIRQHLAQCQAKQLIFILVATPVEEVGRDHDFDWAVVEPSSYRSIIQLAGRVKRHRKEAVKQPNIGLLQYNWKAFKANDQQGEKYFNRPGYEDEVKLSTHDITQLLSVDDIAQRLDAIPRIMRNPNLNIQTSLVDIEHYITHQKLTNYHGIGPEELQGYLTGSWYLTALPQMLNRFRQSEPSTRVFRTYDAESDRYYFAEKDQDGWPIDRENILQINVVELTDKEKDSLWLWRDYDQLIATQAEKEQTQKKWASLKYGELSFIQNDGKSYEYNDQFGLVKLKE